MILTFKKLVGKWFLDFPEYDGTIHDLEMVKGADKLLETIPYSIHEDLRTIEIRKDVFRGWNMGLKLHEICEKQEDGGTGGAYYTVTEPEFLENIWLCDVMLKVLGGFPKYLYAKFENPTNTDEAIVKVKSKDIDFLKETQHNILNEDNRYTVDPIFNVREKYKETKQRNCGEHVEYVEQITGEHLSYDNLDELYQDLSEGGYFDTYEYHYMDGKDNLWEDSEYVEHHYDYNWRIINSHFTEQAANDFIARKGHDYGELSVYVDSLYFCKEMKRIREILKNMEFE